MARQSQEEEFIVQIDTLLKELNSKRWDYLGPIEITTAQCGLLKLKAKLLEKGIENAKTNERSLPKTRPV